MEDGSPACYHLTGDLISGNFQNQFQFQFRNWFQIRSRIVFWNWFLWRNWFLFWNWFQIRTDSNSGADSEPEADFDPGTASDSKADAGTDSRTWFLTYSPESIPEKFWAGIGSQQNFKFPITKSFNKLWKKVRWVEKFGKKVPRLHACLKLACKLTENIGRLGPLL